MNWVCDTLKSGQSHKRAPAGSFSLGCVGARLPYSAPLTVRWIATVVLQTDSQAIRVARKSPTACRYGVPSRDVSGADNLILAPAWFVHVTNVPWHRGSLRYGIKNYMQEFVAVKHFSTPTYTCTHLPPHHSLHLPMSCPGPGCCSSAMSLCTCPPRSSLTNVAV